MKKHILLVAVGLAACSKSGSNAPAVKIDPAAVNALVPADLKAKFEFEKRDVVEERGKRTVTYTMAAPKGWEADGKMFAKLRPGKDQGLGFMTALDVGTNCDGACESKDWAATSEKVNFKQFRDAKIIKDELGKTSHLMIAEKANTTYVVYAWWHDGARKYGTCQVSLEKEAAPAADAFAEACKAIQIKGDD